MSNIEFKDKLELDLKLGKEYSRNMELIKNNLRSEGYKPSLSSEREINEYTDEIRTYKGYSNKK